MPSFLLTKKMSPELAARVRASVHGSARERLVTSDKQGRKGFLRLGLLFAAFLAVWFLIGSYKKSRAEVDEARATLLRRFQTEKDDKRARLEYRLQGLAVSLLKEAGEALPEISGDKRTLSGPLLYARVDLEALTAVRLPPQALKLAFKGSSGSTAFTRALDDSQVDALPLCLLSPATSVKESVLLKKLGQPDPAVQNRLFDPRTLLDAQAFFGSTFKRQTETAQHMSQLERLESKFNGQNLDQVDPALDAATLLFVIDEPVPAGNHADFDGEGAHTVRLGVVDLSSGKVLLRLKRKVSPDWISESSRLQYSRPLDSCKLGFEIAKDLSE